MRLFTAIAIPQAFHPAIANLRDDQLTGARWTSPEQWHITLHFIGETHQLEEIQSALATVQASDFAITLRGIGTFPAKGKPRVLWLGIDAGQALQNLHMEVGTALMKTGFQPEKRAYNPHMTLARFKVTTPSPHVLQQYRETHAGFQTTAFQAQAIHLYESKLTPSGAEYHVRQSVPLSN